MSSLSFKGKSFIQNHHFVVPYHELVSVKSKGTRKTASLHDNVVVEGDNLKALKALLPTYHKKIKCVYIDPPYNTGNERWRYNDAVNSPLMQEWLGREVDREDLTRHDKWCCMMLPRLKLLQELLRNDGVIFVSIDDNEVHRARCLLDEAFGPANFVECIIWKKRNGPPNDKIIGAVHEYVLIYAKDITKAKLNLRPRTEEQIARYKNPDNHAKGVWVAGDLMANVKGGRYVESLRFPIVNPKTREKHWPGEDGNWRFSKDTIAQLLKEDEIWFGENGTGRPKLKRFLCDVKDGTTYSTLWDDVAFNDQATAEIVDIIGDQTSFDTPKPARLIVEILRLATSANDIVLDAFAGSGTTGHATLLLNSEDGGKRRFVLIESEDYADSITAERIRRVSRGISGAKNEYLRTPLGGTFSYFKIAREMQLQAILDGKTLPDFISLARYVFFTATGEEFDADEVDKKAGFIGKTKTYDIFLIYSNDVDRLKELALTYDGAKALEKYSKRPKIVFAPTKYLDESLLDRFGITFCQLPFQIYKA